MAYQAEAGGRGAAERAWGQARGQQMTLLFMTEGARHPRFKSALPHPAWVTLSQ